MLSLNDGAHNVEHIVRVYDWCRELAKNYPETDLNVLKISAYWHDVGRRFESKEKDDHNLKSAQKVEKYLKKEGASEEFISKVKYNVLNHSFKYQPETIEGKILHDADKLAFLSDHEIPDAYDSMKEGYETLTFNIPKLKLALREYYEKKDMVYKGLMLPESKKYYKLREKYFLEIIERIIKEK